MDKKRKKSRSGGGFLWLALVLIGCLGLQLYLRGYFDFVQKLDQVEGKTQLIEYVQEQFDKENTKFTIYVKGVSEEQIKNLNKDMDCFYGTLKNYVLAGEKYDKSQKVTFQLQMSDNYYVAKAIENNEKKVSKGTHAQELLDEVYKIKNKIIKKKMTDYKKELAIHDYLVKNCAYEFLKGEEQHLSYTSYGALIKGKGVCNAYAEAFQLLIQAAGLKGRIVVGQADGEEHAWNMVCLSGDWYQVDVTWDDPVPDEKGQLLHTYFNMTDDDMSDSHTWNKSMYEKCSNDKYNYFVKNDLICDNYEDYKQKVIGLILSEKSNNISLVVKDYNEKTYDLSFVLDQPGVKKASWRTLLEGKARIIVLNIEYK